MPRFAADAALAAMSQRAAQVLKNSGQAALPSGQVAPIPGRQAAQQGAQPMQIPKSLLAQNRVSQLQGGTSRMDPSMVAAMKINPVRAQSRDAIYAAAASRAAAQQTAQRSAYGGDMFSQSDFERGNLAFASQMGLTGEDALAAAAAHAPSYGGVQFSPHNIAQEGEVTYRNGVRGIMIKFSAPGQGSSTEWVPLE